jgi:holo-[acyl-carrier protein] synthase
LILGIGTDLTSIERIAATLEQHGGRFIERCFSKEEQERVESASKDDPMTRAAGYAKRWAAKEACAKALGLGIRDEVFLKNIIVVNDSAGKPELVLQGGAKERLTALTPEGMTPCMHVSLSDEFPVATAFVVISAR